MPASLTDLRSLLSSLAHLWAGTLFGCLFAVFLFSVYAAQGSSGIGAPKQAFVGFIALVLILMIVFRGSRAAEYGSYLAVVVMFAVFLESFVPHPLKQYEIVRTIEADSDYVLSDEIYLRGTNASEPTRYIERTIYSARMFIMSGDWLGMDYPDHESSLPSQWFGIHAWLLGVRAACELFAILTILIGPLIAVIAIFAAGRRRLQATLERENVHPMANGVLLVIPFIVGLSPIFDL